MVATFDNIAQELNISSETLWRESLKAYIARELRLVELDIADIQDRYGVITSEQLEEKIRSGDIYSHPAWEELIEWQNLAAYRDRLARLRALLG